MDYMKLLPHEIEELINEYEAEIQFHFPMDYRLFLKYHNYARLRFIHFFIHNSFIRKQKIINRRQKRTCNNVYFFTLDKSPNEMSIYYSFWNYDYQNCRHYQLTPSNKKSIKKEYVIFATDLEGNLFGFNRKTKKIAFFDSRKTLFQAETIADSFTEFIGTSFENVSNSHGGYA